MTGNVLLTGGFGTLGGRLAAALSSAPGWNIRLASRIKRHAPQWSPDAEVLSVDFDNQESIRNLLDGVTHVVHLAALNDRECKEDPINAHLVNVDYTQRVVEKTIERADVRFIYLSTIQVYGNNLSGTITELTTQKPADTYSSTHLEAEEVVNRAHKAGMLEGVRLRCANGFGAPMTPSAKIWQIVANDLCRQAVETGTLILKSHGLQYRNFIPMTDICRAVQHVLDMDSAKVADGLFNLGGAKSLQILEMAERIADRCEYVLGFRPPLHHPDQPPVENIPELDYRSDKLLSTGLTLGNDIDLEIDDLLRKCQNWFQPRIRKP